MMTVFQVINKEAVQLFEFSSQQEKTIEMLIIEREKKNCRARAKRHFKRNLEESFSFIIIIIFSSPLKKKEEDYKKIRNNKENS